MSEAVNSSKLNLNKKHPSQIKDSTSNNSLESIDHGHLIYTHDGILLRQTTTEFAQDLGTSGSLSILRNSMNGDQLFIEWRPRDIIITDDESQDQDEWSLVDRIYERQRTISEGQIFNTKCESPPKQPKSLKVNINDLRSLEILMRGQAIRFYKRDGTIQSEFFFQNGNADLFVRALEQQHTLNKVPGHKYVYDILDGEGQKLKKTFADLQICDIKESGGWLTNILWKGLDRFAKVPDMVSPPSNLYRVARSPIRNEDYELLDKIQQENENKSRVENNTGENYKNVVEKQDTEETKKDHLPERKIMPRGSPLTEKQWCEFQTEDGRILDSTTIKELIFRGGIEHELRREVWKYLLDYYQWNDSTVERAAYRRRKAIEYYQMKGQWLSITPTQEKNFSGYRDRKCQIEKDVKRTDRALDFFAGDENRNLTILQDILMTYVMYNFDLGYVQGMSDLLAPILAVQQDEVDAFWCFVGFMNIVFSNFDIDQAGMKKQLSDVNRLLEFCNHDLFEYLKSNGSDNMYFCFRWLLVWYKREFSLLEIYELWECLWTRLPCPNFHLLIAVAILDQEKSTIIDNNFEFNEILKHINELSMKINLSKTLELAEAIYVQICTSNSLTYQIKKIIGDDSGLDELKGDKENDSEDSFGEIEVRQQKLEDACDQSMLFSYI